MVVVVIGGPIASGKSTLGRAVAARLHGTNDEQGAVIDLDLVYEMLDPERRPKNDRAIWAEARRVAGRLATAFLVAGRPVVVEGDFVGEQSLLEFAAELPNELQPRLVLLDVDIAKAVERTSVDPTRGLSKDREFLSAHYVDFAPGWDGRDVLRLDTGLLNVQEAANAVIAWLDQNNI